MNDTTFNRLQQCRERIAEDFNKLHKMFQTCHTQEDKHGYILLFTVVDNLHANFTQLRDVLLLDMTEKGYAQFGNMSADELAHIPVLGEKEPV